MNKNVIVRGIYAGILIGLASLLYLSVENAYLGSLLFSLGLLVVCAEGLYLYTGKVGYLARQKNYLKTVITTLVSNAIGITFVSVLGLIAKPNLVHKATLLVDAKLSNPIESVIILSMFCGMMMYIAVEGYQRISNETAKVLVVIFAVMIFILAKFEHSIANMTYLIVSKTITLKSLFYLLLMIFGNGIGASILCFIDKKIDQYSA
ncbi:MAG: formate/nitrite transporter family protein [Paracholeplasma sp.]|nr:formate/nitrite transporter family protein [Paracholeplasma sp.]MDY3195999.1 formate/nitrite transporter family protein [Paracholeplasma sp.]